MDVEQLRTDRAALVDQMRSLTTPPDDAGDDWEMSEEDATRFDELDTEATALTEKIEGAEKRAKRIEALADKPGARMGGDDADRNRGRFDAPNLNKGGDPYDPATIRMDATVGDLRSRVTTALERDDVTPDDVKSRAMSTLARIDGGEGGKRELALRYILTGSENYRSAWMKYMARQEWAMSDAEREAFSRAQSVGTDGAGGFAVPFTLDPTIIGIDGGSINPFRRISRVVQTTTDSWNGVTGTASSFSWDAEAAQVSDDSITLTQPAIPVHRLQGFIPFSIEAGMDWQSIDSDLRMAMAEGRDNAEATAHATGSGSGQPTGIVTALDGGASEVSPQTAETFAVADVYELQRLLPPRHRQAGPRWVMNIGTVGDIRQFDTAGGGQMFGTLANGAPPTLLNWGWDEASELDDSPDINPAATADNHILIVGNWSRYVIVDRVGMTIDLIPHLMGANQRPTGQRGLYALLRSGADSVDDNAFRILNVATTA